MRLIFISGDGHGAGKTYFANKIASDKSQIFSIANMIRKELATEYPNYDWYNKEPRYKIYTIVKETNLSIHQMLINKGNEKKQKNNIYWAKQLVEIILYNKEFLDLKIAIIDDLRYLDEFEFIKRYLQNDLITHIHIINPHAKPEPNYENEKLKELSDFQIISKRILNVRSLKLEKKE